MQQRVQKRNRLAPWYIGIVIVLLSVAFVGYRLWMSGCGGHPAVEIGVLLVVPLVYLALMYLTFTSQE